MKLPWPSVKSLENNLCYDCNRQTKSKLDVKNKTNMFFRYA